ncbi:MAG: hypothetical protein LBP85_05865 [Prevotellaceae bacterium]|jgi:predicted Zn finger-like uncharacterized protein|nr:hypothetical protein [Prevotellaceae bacterium]
MIHTIEIQCPHCHSNDLIKNGKTGNGTQKWQCNSCKKHFQRNIAIMRGKPGQKRK